jgi:hypothetical protein
MDRKPASNWISPNDKDWQVIVLTVDMDDPEDRTEVAERIGCLHAYGMVTNARMLAVLGEPDGWNYELLFSFDTPENKQKFFNLVNSNDLTAVEPEAWLIPSVDEIESAKPLTEVIPPDMMRHASEIAVSLMMSFDDEQGRAC